MNSKRLALDCMKFAELRKAENLVGLDVRKQTSITDFFVICSGSSEPHLKAIVNEIRDQIFKKYRIHPQSMDGMVGSSWIVLDYYDVIVHIMRSDARERYDLESFWGDAIRLSLENEIITNEEISTEIEAHFEEEVSYRRSFVAGSISKRSTLYRHILNLRGNKFRRTLRLHKNIFHSEE